MRVLDNLLALVAPHNCLACGAEGALACESCRLGLRPAIARCYKCRATAAGCRTCRTCRRSSALHAVYPAVQYEGLAKDLVWRLKFGRARAAGSEIAGLMARLPVDCKGATLVHIPTATKRVRARGYDQAALICSEFARASCNPQARLLARTGQQQQVGANRTRRAAQLQQAFRPVHLERISGAHIVLVDDVITTGATLEAAAAVLRAAGAHRVEAVVFAQA